MSLLIDEITGNAKGYAENKGCYKDGWYIAKPLNYWTLRLQWQRIKDACRVLIGRSEAYHYKADEQ